MKCVLMTALFICASTANSDWSKWYNEKIDISRPFFLNQTPGDSEGAERSGPSYWLSNYTTYGISLAYSCGEDWTMCETIRKELNDTVISNSGELEFKTRQILRPPKYQKACYFDFEHLTTLSSGRKIPLTSRGQDFQCSPPNKPLKCNPARYALVQDESGWKYCVWIGIK